MIRRVVYCTLVYASAAAAFAADEKAKPSNERDDPIGRKLSERIGTFVQRLPIFLTKDDKYGAWKKAYDRLTVDEKIRYCIFQLRNESCSDVDEPYSDKPYSTEPEATASRELIKLGRAALPQLIRNLDSRISTNIYPNRHTRKPLLAQDTALDVIENIACRYFGKDTFYPILGEMTENERRKVLKNIAAWWQQSKGLDEIRWAKEVLFSDRAVEGGRQEVAIDSLYFRLGKESYLFLTKAYDRLPKGRENADTFDELKSRKVHILQLLLKSPTAHEKTVLASALHDAPLWVRIDGAEGLWAIGDRSGMEAMVREIEDRLLKDFGSNWLDTEYCNITSFLVRCNTPSSRGAVYKCLSGRNPYLRQEAIRAVPRLRMEKAVRALPELFDDPFVLAGSYQSFDGTTERTVPPRRVCDEAAEAFTKLVPDAPHFDASTSETQQRSIDKMKQWWKDNAALLKWDEKQGVLSLLKKNDRTGNLP